MARLSDLNRFFNIGAECLLKNLLSKVSRNFRFATSPPKALFKELRPRIMAKKKSQKMMFHRKSTWNLRNEG